MGSVRPARRFDALRACSAADLPNRLAPDGGPPCAFALLQRSIATPPHRPAGPKTGSPDDASSPGLSRPTTHAARRTRVSRGFRPRGVPRRVLAPVSRRPPPCLPGPEGLGASMGFSLQGFGPRVDRWPSRAPCLRVVARVDSPRSLGACGRGRLQGLVPDAQPRVAGPLAGPVARVPSWDSSLQSVLSLRPGLRVGFAGPPSSRIRRRDVAFRLRLEVFRIGGLGWSLSGLPALLGFSTLRPSRHRGDGGGTRAHGLASPSGRVAGGPSGSLHPRLPSDPGFRRGPTPPSFGGRLSTSSVQIGRAHV